MGLREGEAALRQRLGTFDFDGLRLGFCLVVWVDFWFVRVLLVSKIEKMLIFFGQDLL